MKVRYSFFALIAVFAAQDLRGEEVGRLKGPEDLESFKGVTPAPSSFFANETLEKYIQPHQKAHGVNSVASVPLSALAATRDRPLFSASRRPPNAPTAQPPGEIAAKPVAIEAPKDPRPSLTLVGTIVSGREQIALLLNETTKIITRVKKGEIESGWFVKMISTRTVTIQKDSKLLNLTLRRPGDNSNASDQLPPSSNPSR